jgi:hypothetical protein
VLHAQQHLHPAAVATHKLGRLRDDLRHRTGRRKQQQAC